LAKTLFGGVKAVAIDGGHKYSHTSPGLNDTFSL
jgi:hypothetical protein